MPQIRKRLTYANVMSSLAVFLVVAGGSAFAATQLGKNTVGTKQLKKEAVSLAKINTAAKNALKGATGPIGATGPQGAKGEKGDTGPSTGPAGGALTGNYPNPGLAAEAVTAEKIAKGSIDGTKLGTITTVEETIEVAGGSIGFTVANCGTGTLLSLGYLWDANVAGLYTKDLFRFLNAGVARGVNTTGATHKFTLQLTCLS